MSGRREYRKRQWRRRQSRKLELLLKGSMIAAVVLVLVLIGIKVASTVQSRNEQKRAEEALNQQQEKMVAVLISYTRHSLTKNRYIALEL